MRKPTKKQIEHAKRVVADPGFQYSLLMHRVLAHCYRGDKRARLEAYREAGIHESLAGAERRARKAAK